MTRVVLVLAAVMFTVAAIADSYAADPKKAKKLSLSFAHDLSDLIAAPLQSLIPS